MKIKVKLAILVLIAGVAYCSAAAKESFVSNGKKRTYYLYVHAADESYFRSRHVKLLSADRRPDPNNLNRLIPIDTP